MAESTVHGMNLRRKAVVAWGRVKDYSLEFPTASCEDEALAAAQSRIDQAYASLPPVSQHDQRLVDFLHHDCEMKLEHTDGSFMDHLSFGNEYAARHFKGYSPRVLLLHSIMGLGTNHFPMEAEKIPRLRELVTEFEMRHVESFPSIVRLWAHGRLSAKLLSCSSPELCHGLKGISFHRVIDNRRLWMDADSFWIHLNYQLMHYIDFFPAFGWSTSRDPGMIVFRLLCTELISVLERAGKLLVNLEFEPRLTVGELPKPLALSRRMQRWEKISKKIGHSLDFELIWEEGLVNDGLRPRL